MNFSFFYSSKQGFHSVIHFFRLTYVCACLFLLSLFLVFFCRSTSRLRTNHIRYHFSIFIIKKKTAQKEQRVNFRVFQSKVPFLQFLKRTAVLNALSFFDHQHACRIIQPVRPIRMTHEIRMQARLTFPDQLQDFRWLDRVRCVVVVFLQIDFKVSHYQYDLDNLLKTHLVYEILTKQNFILIITEFRLKKTEQKLTIKINHTHYLVIM